MAALAQWLDATAFSQAVRRAAWLIPLLQSVHILAIAAVLSSVAMIGLRIAGFGRSQTVAATAGRFAPWLWIGLIVLAMTGTVLIAAEPKRSLPNAAFQLKMLLLVLAVASATTMAVSLRKHPLAWEGNRCGGAAARALAALTLALWCAIAIAGRWIAYAQDT